MSIQGCFPLGLTDLISLQSKALSRVFSSTTFPKHQFFNAQPSLWSNTHIHIWLMEKPSLGLYSKVMSLLFNTLSRFVIAFLPRSKCLLISWLQSLSTLILESKKIKSHCLHCFPIYLSWSNGTGPITLWEIDGETVEPVADFIFWAAKSLQMVTAAMKLKDAYSLEGK